MPTTISDDVVGLSFVGNLANNNGSPVQDLSGFQVFYKDVLGGPDVLFGSMLAPSLTRGDQVTFVFPNFPFLHSRSYEIWVVAVDLAGNVSAPSTIIVFEADSVAPRPPQNVEFVLQ